MQQRISVHLPAQYSINTKIGNNLVQQVVRPAFSGQALVRERLIGRARTYVIVREDGSEVLVVGRAVLAENWDGDVLLVAGAGKRDMADTLGSSTRKVWLRVTHPWYQRLSPLSLRSEHGGGAGCLERLLFVH